MSRENGTLHETAFTVSIEAREGVSTGISTADRARTISVAINGANGRADIVSPGHVFPLVAKDGGVLIRTGHTEAAVDVARLAGLNPSGVICEIMTIQRFERLGDRLSHVLVHNGIVYLTGQVADDGTQDTAGQTRQILERIDMHAGESIRSVVVF